jgi:hypothetical protein
MRHFRGALFSISPILLLLATKPAAAQPAGKAAFDSAYFAWDAGNYPDALARMRRLLESADGDAYVEAVALLTGEAYRSVELTPNGAAPRWSLDGRVVAFETGAGAAALTRVVALEAGGPRVLAELRGRGPVLAADGGRAAWFAARETTELRNARAELDRMTAAGNRQGAAGAQQEIRRLETETSRILVRDLATGRETEIQAPGITRGALAFGDDGELYLIGGTPGAPAPAGGQRGGQRGGGAGQALGDRVLRVTGAGAPASMLPMGPVGAINGVRALRGGRLLLELGQGRVATLDLTTGASRTFEGTSPVVSADGRWLALLNMDAQGTTVSVAATDGRSEPRVVKRSSIPLTNPALSPDGSRVAYAMMPREDWEIYVIGSDGQGEFRVTREIQHDIVPQFLSNDRLLGLMGEPRHRRSYLYALPAAAQPEGAGEAQAGTALPGTPGRTRLHHNNTVRTVAPEYEWVPSPDGTKVLIVADRDGDTISPERGLYLLDLGQRVDKAGVLSRLAAQSAAEMRLREAGEHAFLQIRPAVADAVADVSTGRIYAYANDVFQFDSKHITQPGNAKAIAYYAAKLRDFGYEPELQWFEPRPGVRTANIIAKLRGTVDPHLIYVVSSHFDSVERGPGADDDSSGATALLEAARVLAGRPQPATIHFAFFTGEEAGLLGSREYVRRAVANNDRIIGALNNDMIGFQNDHRYDNTIRYSNPGIRDLQHAAAFLFTKLITYDAKYYRSTDAAAYYEAYGDIVGGIGSYPILGNPHYHQSHDQLETIDQQLVAEVSKTTVATLMVLASSPARLKDLKITQAATTQLEWAASPESGITEYVVAWGPREDPMRDQLRVREARATLRTKLPAGSVVSVKAINQRGLEGWDWARVEISQ